jgi:quercetin dioxygenase-like cupin family protein
VGADNFYSLSDLSAGIPRELTTGITARVFSGDQAMVSVVSLAPNAEGTIHSHPEEQWGVMLEGTGIRIQDGQEVAVKAGDFWRTPGGVPHGLRAGPKGAKVLDVFAPPRREYQKAGQGFGQERI